MSEAERAEALRRPPRPAREARADAGGGHRPVPARVRRARGHRRGAGRARGAGAGDRDRVAPPRRRAASSAAAATARPASSTCATAAARSSCTPARTCSARRPYELLVDLDLGDIVGVEGTALATRRGGELSLAIDHWRLLAKSLRPPPDKFHGLEDVETRYRRRELDLIANEESRRALRDRAPARSREVRRWLDEHGFVEVETPVLQPLYGGALARPFTTHHNALDRDLYLRIATELYLKRLVVGGIDRVYELGKDFRNEGVSHKHNPEFTMLEWYEAYADYEKTAHDLELLVAEVAERVLGTTKVERDGVEIDFAPPWRRITLREAIRERSRHRHRRAPDPRGAGRRRWGPSPTRRRAGASWSTACSRKQVEPELIQPTFVLDYPVELSPFAKAPPLRAGAGRALGGLRRRRRDRQLLHRAQRPRRAAPPLRAAGRRAGARRRGGAALRRGLRRGARTGDAADRRRRPRHRPPGDDADRRQEPARGRALPGDAHLSADRMRSHRTVESAAMSGISAALRPVGRVSVSFKGHMGASR